MYPKNHLILGAVFAILLHLFFPQINILYIVIMFFSSVLIDADHFLYYAIAKKDFSLINAYRWYTIRMKKFCSLPKEQRKKIHSGIFIFHGIEILAIMLLLGIYVSQFFFFIFLGLSFHMLLDIPDEIIKKGTLHKLSLIYSIISYQKLRE